MAVSCPNISGSFLPGLFAMLREMELHHLRYHHSRHFAELRAKVTVRIGKLDGGKGVEWNIVEIKAEGRALLSLGWLVAGLWPEMHRHYQNARQALTILRRQQIRPALE